MRIWISSLLAIACLTTSAAAAEPEREAIEFFEKRIRPVLAKHCYQCHSEKARQVGKLKGGLSLDTRDAVRMGGDSGAAVSPGKPAESLLLNSIRYGEDSYQMPPSGKLPESVIADFAKWIRDGAADPRTSAAASAPRTIDWKKARRHWAFQTPQRFDTPKVRNANRVRRPIDAFLLAKLEAKKLAYSAPAQRETLLRRAVFDLHGLPPTAEQRKKFLADESDTAYDQLIERLLDSPRYGERWARHWLDVARYAEDNTNMGPHNGPYPHAWRYRDWVVSALNQDMPFDEFVIRQLAVDFLDDCRPEDMAALGFQGLAPSYHKEVALAKLVLENRYADEWEDRVDAIGRGLLGLTLACARCHDHKYDPVTSEDYYSLASVFASCRQTTRPVISAEEIAKTQSLRDQAKALEARIASRDKQVKDLEKAVAELAKKIAAQKKKPSINKESTSKPDSLDAKNIDDAPVKKGEKSETAESSETSKKAAPQAFDPEKAKQQIDEKKKRIAKAKQENIAAKKEIDKLKKTKGFEIPVANALTEEQVRVEEINKQRMKIVYYAEKPRDLNVFIRGDAGKLGAQVARGFLTLFSEGQRAKFTKGSGRLELAEAIANPDNPLTGRVIVNRIWQQHFGVGIVDSPSNFGRTGSPPSHPRLLDDLTVRFIKNGWSLKWLHREIMNSSAYQQSSQPDLDSARTSDPDNRLLSRFPRRRLEAEAVRDSVLAVSGQLDDAVGGPSGDIDSPDFKRRALYAMVSRHKLSDTLQTFDFPDPAIHCAARSRTTTPLQQMFMLNSPFMQQQAAALAKRIQSEGGSDLDSQIQFAHVLLFAREASPVEMQIAKEFLMADKEPGDSSAITPSVLEPPTFSESRIHARVPGLAAKTSYSFEIWFRNTLRHNARPVSGYFFSRGKNAGGDDHGDHLGISGVSGGEPGRLMFYSGSPHKIAIRGATTLSLKSWRHAVLVRDDEKATLYLDGQRQPDAVGKAAWSFDRNVTDVFIGGRRDNFANFQGQLQEAAIYDRALTPQEIQTHFGASGLPKGKHDHKGYSQQVLKSKPLAYWPLNSDRQQSKLAIDLSGNDFHGAYESRGGAVQGPPTNWARYAHALLSSNEFLFID